MLNLRLVADLVLDVRCPGPHEPMRASARRVRLDLAAQYSPGLADPGDQLTVNDRDLTLVLRRSLSER